MPALFTRPHSPPASSAAATAAAGRAGSATSPTSTVLGPGSDAAISRRSDSVRATITGWPPDSDTAMAVPLPMPREAPVTITTRPSRLNGFAMTQGYARLRRGVRGRPGHLSLPEQNHRCPCEIRYRSFYDSPA